jgi:DNA polymerase-3 subunit gamma/tau
LEEPPPHVKFLLATTDPQKVPVTVLSRCLQFNLKRLLLDEIQDRLQDVLQQEKINFEQPALLHLARAADGSMRDGLSLMDQAIAFGGGEVKEADVRSMLGTVDKDQVHRVLQALADQDPQQVMVAVANMAERVPDFAGVLQELLALLHRIALQQAVPGAVDESAGDREELSQLAEAMLPEDVQLYYQIGLIGQRDLPQAPDLRSGFEMVLLRMLAFRPDRGDMATSGAAPSRPAKVASGESRQKPSSGKGEAAAATSSPSQPAAEISDWSSVVAQLGLGGIAQQLAHNCRYESWDGKRLLLQLDPEHQQLKVESAQQRLQKALEGYLNCSLKLDIEVGQQGLHTPAVEDALERSDRQQEAESIIAADPMVQAMGKKFGSRPVPGSIKPIDE